MKLIPPLLITVLMIGCSWARHTRSYISTPAVQTQRGQGKRYFRVRLSDGTTRRAILDSQGRLRYVDERPAWRGDRKEARR